MGTTDTLTEWAPIQLSSQYVFVESVVDDETGLRINLVEHTTNKKFEVLFHFYFSYRNTDERFLLNMWGANEKLMLGKTFYVMENSTYIEFLKSSSNGLQPAISDAKHYCIFTQADCIEVITTTTPSVRIL